MKYSQEQPDSIQAMFGSIAKSYDRTNAILSFQLHRFWNRSLIKKTLKGRSPKSLLDLCCGTGEIGLNYLKQSPSSKQLYFLDFSAEMLACAKEKAGKMGHNDHKIEFLHADAQKIPLGDSSVEAATIAYGIRNVKNPALCFAEVYRVLKPGAVFGILELTRPTNSAVRIGHRFYLKNVLPLVGRLFARNKAAYQYLCSSIDTFVKPEDLIKILRETGFQEIEQHKITCGIATILVAKKTL